METTDERVFSEFYRHANTDQIGTLLIRVDLQIREGRRSLSKFIQYALAASDEALKDAAWPPKGRDPSEKLEQTV